MQKRYPKLTWHAKFDCIPLRFGFIPQVDAGVLTAKHHEAGTNGQKPSEIRRGNKHFKGDLELTDGQLISNATFVVSSDDRLISVFIEESRATRGVGELVRAMREANKIDSQWIVDNLYAPYRDGKMKSELDLVNILVDLGIQAASNPTERPVQPGPTDDELDAARKRIEELEAAILTAEGKKPGYQGQDIALSPICTLEKVEVGSRTNAKGMVVGCTRLYFEEDVPVRIMDNWADPDGRVSEEAKRLIGKKVRTTSWKPESFSPLKWFRSIYETDG
jgi:hypothetical protein